MTFFSALTCKKTNKVLLSFVLHLTFISCSSPEDKFDFNSTTWKSDTNGCKGQRPALKKELEKIRLQLIGVKEPVIRKLFGKPETEELLERSNKIYIYYITPGPKCGDSATGSTKGTEALAIRMDALGNVREANIFTE